MTDSIDTKVIDPAAHETVQWAFVDPRFVPSDGIHTVLVGPFATREEAEKAADGLEVVEWWGGPATADNPCRACGSTGERLPMSEAAGKVYDALFPGVLDWSEEEDCGMGGLMREIAEAAAAALGADTTRPI